MSRAVGVAALLLAVVASAACTPSVAPAEQRDMQAQIALYAAYKPFATCIEGAAAGDPAFAGQLPERVVAAGLAPELQRLRQRHLGKTTDVAAQPPAVQVEATRAALLALAAFGAGRDAPKDEPAAMQMRRLVSVVEMTLLTSRALDTACEPSENLVKLMEQAEHDYF